MNKQRDQKLIGVILFISIVSVIGFAVAARFTPWMELNPEGQIVYLSPEDAARIADVILIGVVQDIQTEPWAAEHHPLVKIVKVLIIEYLKNPLADEVIEVRLNGEGIADVPGIGRVKVIPPPWEADFRIGEKVLLFLDFDEGNVLGSGYYTVGGFQGKYTIVDQLAINRDPSRNKPLSELVQIIKDALRRG